MRSRDRFGLPGGHRKRFKRSVQFSLKSASLQLGRFCHNKFEKSVYRQAAPPEAAAAAAVANSAQRGGAKFRLYNITDYIFR